MTTRRTSSSSTRRSSRVSGHRTTACRTSACAARPITLAKPGAPSMISRRLLLGAAAAAPLLYDRAFADTPKDAIVMAKRIDDIISLDPQEAFEYSGSE